MAEQTEQPTEMWTTPIAEHKWIEQLVGDWSIESEMDMPDGSSVSSSGKLKVTSLGGLWAFGEGEETMWDGTVMVSKFGMGYDVSFREYRAFWIANISSHLWRYTGQLSDNGKAMTLDCEGPNMEKDGETALYRDVYEILDENTHTRTTFGQNDAGEWVKYMVATYRRVR